MAMSGRLLRSMGSWGMLWVALLTAQDIPLTTPHLLPLPGVSVGIGYFRLIPTQNLILNGTTGWSIQDTLPAVASELDLELLRYRWWDHFLSIPHFDGYASLGYSVFTQLGSIALPNGFPTAFKLYNTTVSDFQMNTQISELYLSNQVIFNLGHRNSFHGNFALGYASLKLYQNGSGVRILSSKAPAFHFGLGWKITLLGRPGKRIRLGVTGSYSLRSFDLAQTDENLKLPDGNSGAVSPIQSLKINSPELKVSLDFGEALFNSYTSYREPYRLGLLNIGAGTGLINYEPGITLQFDTSGTALQFPFFAKLSQSYSLQFFEYNWLFHVLRQANIDLLSGLGVRLWKNSQGTPLPDSWAHDFTNGSTTFSGMSFAPRVIDWYLNHALIYPLGPRLQARFTGATGLGLLTLYQNGVSQRLIDATGFTWQFAGGLGYTFKGDGSSKVDLGITLGYYHQAFQIDMSQSNLRPLDAEKIVPLTFVDLSQPIFSITIGLIFGGSPNAAQRAHTAFLKQDYAAALDLQDELLLLNPNHHNKGTMLLERQMINDSLVTTYYRDVRKILGKGKLQNAFTLIQHGETPPDDHLKTAVKAMTIEISNQALERAAKSLKSLDYERAEAMILLALKSDPTTFPVAKVLLARSYIIRATILYQSGVFKRSLYWLKQADGLTDRYKLVTADLRQHIGDGRLDDANAGILKQDRHLVYDAMAEAKALNPVLSEIVDQHLQDLQAAMDYSEEQQLGSMKRMALDNLLDDVSGLTPENFQPQIGMRGAVMARYVGAPVRRFHEAEYELWVYPKPEGQELWLYLRNGVIEKIDLHDKLP